MKVGAPGVNTGARRESLQTKGPHASFRFQNLPR